MAVLDFRPHSHAGSVPEQAQVITPLNNDPFIGMLETPVTSAPIVCPPPSCPSTCLCCIPSQSAAARRWLSRSAWHMSERDASPSLFPLIALVVVDRQCCTIALARATERSTRC